MNFLERREVRENDRPKNVLAHDNCNGTSHSGEARQRMLKVRGEPLFVADWLRTIFIHFEVPAKMLQGEVPFELDLWEGKAFLSLVAFTMRGMRPRVGGRLAKWLFRPIATHQFLNVRAYVNHRGEPGIYFLAEWMNNVWSAKLGPALFGLPYRLGKLEYAHEHELGRLAGLVQEGPAKLGYDAALPAPAQFQPCETGTQEEFLLERYTAFTQHGSKRRYFRIWHPPWPQAEVQIESLDCGLLTRAWPWFEEAKLLGANYSPGFQDVWMGRAQLAIDERESKRLLVGRLKN